MAEGDVAAVIDAAEESTPTGNPDWQDNLILNKEGSPRSILANAVMGIHDAPELAGVVRYCEFRDKVFAVRRPPWDLRLGDFQAREWCDRDDLKAAEWLQHHGVQVGVEVTAQAVQSVAGGWPFHPVRDYLLRLRCLDTGGGFLDGWLHRFMGAEDTPYVRAVGRKFLISAVARVSEPGCKADALLVLEGSQGIGKSSALRVLAGEWFTDEIGDFGSKEAAEQTAGVWFIEVSELEGLGRADINKVKAFASRSVDRYRPAYGRRVREYPRQCVLAGTCNRDDYLRDETGNRRFWPVRCSRIDLDALRMIRDELWAEAVKAYRAGEPWWLDRPDLVQAAADETAARYHEDPWDETIRTMLQIRDEVSISEVLNRLGIAEERRTQADANRVSRSLKAAGWERFQKRGEVGRTWLYRPGTGL